ncbi:MAG: hypothetical protein EXR11_02330 [Rhodospirillaceae bacterium]|nr:hypothetical protein [Rhodospirillaceae bacterium]
MPASHPVMTRVSSQTKAKLRAIAKTAARSEAYLAREAIEQYVETNDWQVALIERRLAEYEAGGPTIPHEEIVRRIKAKGIALKNGTGVRRARA